jgi:predicted transcriptional regulator
MLTQNDLAVKAGLNQSICTVVKIGKQDAHFTQAVTFYNGKP